MQSLLLGCCALLLIETQGVLKDLEYLDSPATEAGFNVLLAFSLQVAKRGSDQKAAGRAAAADVAAVAANGAAAAAIVPNGDSAAGLQLWFGRTVAAALRPASAAAAAATHAAKTAAAAADAIGVGKLLLCSAAGAAASASLSAKFHQPAWDNTPQVLKQRVVSRLTPEEMDAASRHGWAADGE